MFKTLVLCLPALLVSAALTAQETPRTDEAPKADAAPPTAAPPAVKSLSGMSILGNQEAPKSLVIVPWKSSQIGTGIGLSNALGDRTAPVDKDVFIRELTYYEIRSNGGE